MNCLPRLFDEHASLNMELKPPDPVKKFELTIFIYLMCYILISFNLGLIGVFVYSKYIR
jgi:hypothetical protein